MQARAQWQQAPELPRPVQQELAARYHQAVARIVAAWPAAFAGTDLDPEATRKRMEKLLARVEELVASRSRPDRRTCRRPSCLAQQLRERLAANTMAGGARALEAERRTLARGRAGSAKRAGPVDAPRTRAAAGGRSAQRAIPASLPSLLRSASTRVVAPLTKISS